MNENITTAEFWEYDSRIGRRWNEDPKQNISENPYLCFRGNPIYFSDPLGDTIKIYGVAEGSNTTLADKGGTADLGGKSVEVKGGGILVPAINPKDNNKLVGYNVFDSKDPNRKMPVLQLEPEDLIDFKQNSESYIAAARMFYLGGEPSVAVKKQIAGVETGNSSLFLKGLRQENKEFWTDPMRALPALLVIGHSALSVLEPRNLVNIRNPNYQSMKTIEVPVNNLEVLPILRKIQPTGTWLKVYDAAYLNSEKVEVHYFLHKQTGEFFDSKITRRSWSKRFLKGKNKIQ